MVIGMSDGLRRKIEEAVNNLDPEGSSIYIRLYSGGVDTDMIERNSDMDTTTTTQPATEKQIAFIKSLLVKHTGFREEFAVRVISAINAGTLPKDKASSIIDWLLKKPLRPKAEIALIAAEAKPTSIKDLPDIPAGHYAIKSITGNNDLDFFRVDRPDTGKWAGATFVKRIVGGHPDYGVKGATRREVLERIEAAGISASATLYGTEIGRCYRCNRELTDELSRELGIGPHCRAGGHD